MIDESTYGFRKSDAEELIQLIGGGDVEFEEMKPPAKNANAIIDIRVSGLNFQYTKDGTNWTTWHTGEEDCPA